VRVDVTLGRLVVEGEVRDRRALAASVERAIRARLAVLAPPAAHDAERVRDAVGDAVARAAGRRPR
jgi:hypothetical protein